MALLQKISRPRVRILGTDYSSRIVGLHNRFRAHAQRLLVYKDISRFPRAVAARARGLFVAGSPRHVVYLRRGAPESTVAHELIHALLCTEGFLPLRCRTDDLARHPEIASLAESLSDLLVHPIVLARLRRYGFAPAPDVPGAVGPASSRRPKPVPRHGPDLPPPPANARAALRLLARAVAAAEARHRAAAGRAGQQPAFAPGSRAFEKIVDAIAAMAPWDPDRRALDARVRAAAILRYLEETALARWGIHPALPERILVPPYLTPGRLDAPASRFFDVRVAGAEGDLVLVVFRIDGAACSARSYADPERAGKVTDAVRREIGSMTAAQFIERHRLEYILIERHGRCRPGAGGRPRI